MSAFVRATKPITRSARKHAASDAGSHVLRPRLLLIDRT